MKLLRSGVSERAILHVISATPGKVDTSADALTALKQAGPAKRTQRNTGPGRGAHLSACCRRQSPTADARSHHEVHPGKLGEVGTVNFAGYVHDSADNTDGVQKVQFHDQRHRRQSRRFAPSVTIASSSLTAEKNTTRMFLINLRDVQSVAVLPDDQDWQMYLVKTGDTTKTVKDVPDIFVLNIKLPRGV